MENEYKKFTDSIEDIDITFQRKEGLAPSIHLKTFYENTTLTLPNVSTKIFDILLDELLIILDNSPKEEKTINTLANTMLAYCREIKESYISTELKPGYIWQHNKKEDRLDKWSDGLTFEKWCSVEQVAKEFYARQEARNKKR